MIHSYQFGGLPVQTGDILCTTDGTDRPITGRFWQVFGLFVPGPIDHVALYVGPGGRCVESGPAGVTMFEVDGNTWDAQRMAHQRARLTDTLYGVAYPLEGRGLAAEQEEAIRRDVAEYCLQQAAADKPYNLNFAASLTERAFYCTQLVYLAYLRHGIDFNTGQGMLGMDATECFILPQEIWDACGHRRLVESDLTAQASTS
jgi:uncharacterized protein YycO